MRESLLLRVLVSLETDVSVTYIGGYIDGCTDGCPNGSTVGYTEGFAGIITAVEVAFFFPKKTDLKGKHLGKGHRKPTVADLKTSCGDEGTSWRIG